MKFLNNTQRKSNIHEKFPLMKNVAERAYEKSGRNKRDPKGETRKTCPGPVDDERRRAGVTDGVTNEREAQWRVLSLAKGLFCEPNFRLSV